MRTSGLLRVTVDSIALLGTGAAGICAVLIVIVRLIVENAKLKWRVEQLENAAKKNNVFRGYSYNWMRWSEYALNQIAKAQNIELRPAPLPPVEGDD